MTPNRTQLRTACPLDCPDSCSLEATVEDGRLVALEGSSLNPTTAGYMCAKVKAYPRLMYGEERLRRPMVRRGAKGEGRFEPIAWEEALELASGKLVQVRQRHGGEAILPFSYGGSNGLLTQDTTAARLFRRLGASRLARTVCAAATGAAAEGLYGKMPGVAFEDYRHARMIVVWGANPSASGIHLVPPIREAQKAGAKLVVVDPRRIPLAKRADLHLPVRPGTDLPLALALIRWLFEHGHADLPFLDQHTIGWQELRRRARAWTCEKAAAACGLEIREIEAFAHLYAETSPAVIRCGWGQERNRNGASATAAILALPAVAGKFGVRGGGYTGSNSGAWRGLDSEAVIGEPESASGTAPPRRINMNRLGRELLGADPAIRLLFVYNANPLSTLPRQDLVRRGLEREDLFTVVLDPVLTDTARYADLLLPATTFLEHTDLRAAYGAYALQTLEPVAEPVDEARPNYRVFQDLIRRSDLEREHDVPADQLLEAFLKQPYLDSGQRRDLAETGLAAPAFGTAPVLFRDVYPNTPDRKVHLVPEALDRHHRHGRLYTFAEDPATELHPLSLISPATRKTISSSLGNLVEGRARLELHADDAGRRGIATGDRVRVRNAQGEVIVCARVSDDTRPGVAILPKGLWDRHTENGWTSNVLAPDTYTDLGEGATFNDTRVQVERAEDA
ncbi:MAG: molybdopterin-dependent oxidoreductase [Holophagales bacterium]|nr:molybdopterin-dependent oxidoreductase [Holophagales bacterium]